MPTSTFSSFLETFPIGYHQLCILNRTRLSCHDGFYLCICADNHSRVNFFLLDDQLDRYSQCLADARCLQGNPHRSTDFFVFVPRVIQVDNVNSIPNLFSLLLINSSLLIFSTIRDKQRPSLSSSAFLSLDSCCSFQIIYFLFSLFAVVRVFVKVVGITMPRRVSSINSVLLFSLLVLSHCDHHHLSVIFTHG